MSSYPSPRQPSQQERSPAASAEGAATAEVASLQKKARRGVVLLVARTALIQIIVLVGQVDLARTLTPRDFGVYGILFFVMNFLQFFGDAGVGAALVRKKGEPTSREVGTVFTFQLLVGLGVTAICWAAADLVPIVWHELPTNAPWLLRTISASILMTAIRVAFVIGLERRLGFARLALVDVIQSTSFYVIAVPLARHGYGTWALVIGLVAQATLGTLSAAVFAPVRIRLVLDRDILRELITFGIPFQLKFLVGFVNAAVTPLYAGIFLGTRDLGLIQWGITTAYFPIKLVDVMTKVSFPLFSKVQHDQKALVDSLGRAVSVCALGTFFCAAMFFSIGENIVDVVYTGKWVDALVVLRVVSLALCIGFVSPLIGTALDAIGKPQYFARLTIAWTVVNWLVVPLPTLWAGRIGFAWAYIVHMVLGNLLALWLVRRAVGPFNFFSCVRSHALAGVVTSTFAYFVVRPWANAPWSLIAGVLSMIAVFLGVSLLVDRKVFEKPALASAG